VSAYRFIAAERASFSVALMCQVLGVSRSGFYDWAKRAPSRRTVDDRSLSQQIRQIHRDSRGVYGAPRITAQLRAQGLRVSRKRVARLMRAGRLQGRHLRRPPSERPKAFHRPMPTCSPGASIRVRSTVPGPQTSPTSRPAKGGCTWPS